MRSALLRAYRSLVPFRWREQWARRRNERPHRRLRREVLDHYARIPATAIEPSIAEALTFLRTHPITAFPYAFTKAYSPDRITLHREPGTGRPYVQHEGRPLFFRADWDERMIAEYYCGLLMDQDPRSPHLYLTPAFALPEQAVVVDAGVAEGNFTLSIVERASEVHLFEADAKWIEALERTFAPWRHKVFLNHRFLGAVDDARSITLDTYFAGRTAPHFIKADVDGAERALLDGAHRVLRESPGLQLALCTYHKQGDADEFERTLTDLGYAVTFSEGHMLFIYDTLTPPYFRKGVLRARAQGLPASR